MLLSAIIQDSSYAATGSPRVPAGKATNGSPPHQDPQASVGVACTGAAGELFLKNQHRITPKHLQTRFWSILARFGNF